MSPASPPPSERPGSPRSPLERGVDALAQVAYQGAYLLAHVWWFVRRPETEGALVAVWCGRRVLLLQNSYKRALSMPGGGRDARESPEEAAARELREEVGLRVEPSALRLTFQATGTEEFKRDKVYFFELQVEAEPAVELDHREVVWAGFVEGEEALRLHLTPMVRSYLEEAVRGRR